MIKRFFCGLLLGHSERIKSVLYRITEGVVWSKEVEYNDKCEDCGYKFT